MRRLEHDRTFAAHLGRQAGSEAGARFGRTRMMAEYVDLFRATLTRT
jgi:hypothetical protein